MGVDNSVIELITLRSSIATNTLREERIGRRAYLVAPVVAVVAGVLNGALLPVDEIDKLPDAWNGRPLVNDHPHSDDGYMSANAPGVLAGAWLGQVFGAYVEDDRLKGEAWFDLEMAESVPGGRDILHRLRRGEIVETSTAYWCRIEPTEGEYNGKPYSGIQRDIVPDHLAILPNAVGACSIKDGCGVGRINSLQCQEEQMAETVEVTAQCDCDDEATVTIEAPETPEAPVAQATVDGFAQFAEQFGGAEALATLLKSVQANVAQERDTLTAKVLANKALGLTADDLQGMNEAALRKLAAVAPTPVANYAGAGGSQPEQRKVAGIKPYVAPKE